LTVPWSCHCHVVSTPTVSQVARHGVGVAEVRPRALRVGGGGVCSIAAALPVLVAAASRQKTEDHNGADSLCAVRGRLFITLSEAGGRPGSYTPRARQHSVRAIPARV
jgi:hypothetical protein